MPLPMNHVACLSGPSSQADLTPGSHTFEARSILLARLRQDGQCYQLARWQSCGHAIGVTRSSLVTFGPTRSGSPMGRASMGTPSDRPQWPRIRLGGRLQCRCLGNCAVAGGRRY